MSEKRAIERSTAEGFLELYNQRFGTDYEIVDMPAPPDPDVLCADTRGKRLNLEVTNTEDQPEDIKAFLGRSDHLSIEALRARNLRRDPPQFRAFTESPDGRPTVVDQLVARLAAKMQNDYGRDVALVVRDTSPIGWDWDQALDLIRDRINLSTCSFDRGVWLLSRSKDQLFEIVGDASYG